MLSKEKGAFVQGTRNDLWDRGRENLKHEPSAVGGERSHDGLSQGSERTIGGGKKPVVLKVGTTVAEVQRLV